MSNRKPLEGTKIGRWTVLEYVGMKGKSNSYYSCRCDCGTLSTVSTQSLTSGNSTRCLHCRSGGHKIHGHNRNNKPTPTYKTWHTMKIRCSNPKSNRWKYYGGKGVKVCERWNDFKNFLADMGERPVGMTLDRINTNGDYTPDNCKWSTYKEQNNNRRKRRHSL
jgi:hypothetical protein